jgi:cytidyltransferase-like protein
MSVMTPTIYTGGTFDLLHPGHINFLEKCKELAGINGKLIVCLNSDEFVERFKGNKPIMNAQERHIILKSCRFVDEVYINQGDEDSKIMIDKVRPNYIAIGSDWARRDYYKQMDFTQDWLDQRNIGLIYITYSSNVSSTSIKTRFK